MFVFEFVHSDHAEELDAEEQIQPLANFCCP